VLAGSVVFVPPINPAEFPGLAGQVRSQVKVYYGNRPTDGGTKLVPIKGGQLRLVYPLAPDGIPLQEDAVLHPGAKAGIYVLDLDVAGVELLEHEEYRVEAVDGDQRYGVGVTAPSAVPDSDAVHLDPIDHGLNEPLTLPHPGDGRLAFVVVRWAPDPERPQCKSPPKPETYSSVPKSAKDVNDLAKDDERWRADPIVIPGTAFPVCGGYAVVVAAMARGSDASGDLFVGSQLVAGKATGQVYRVR
jgi:hypothetical protein